MEIDHRYSMVNKSHVEWDVFYETRKDLVKSGVTKLDIHICNDDDYAEFFEANEMS